MKTRKGRVRQKHIKTYLEHSARRGSPSDCQVMAIQPALRREYFNCIGAQYE